MRSLFVASLLLLLPCACEGLPEGEGEEGEGEEGEGEEGEGEEGEGEQGEGEGEGEEDVVVAFFNVEDGVRDPRFARVPTEISRVELLPRVSFIADTDAFAAAAGVTVESVRFDVDGVVVVDNDAPYVFGDAALDLDVGDHSIAVAAFAADDANAQLTTSTTNLTVTALGTDLTPDEGEHSQHRLWITDAGEVVHRDVDGDYVNEAGDIVLAGDEVSVDTNGTGQSFLRSPAGRPQLAFGFFVLLPDGFSPDVRYPLLVLLHHGFESFRGTDVDGILLDLPPVNGPRSIASTEQRHNFPAVILVPQLQFHDRIGDVNHEWAAFTAIDGETGNCTSAAEPSLGAVFVRGLVDDLLAGELLVEGARPRIDAARLYLTGHSMGGLGTWDFIEREPGFWAAAVPMAGFPDHARAAALTNTRIWAFHHRIDCFNTFAGTNTMFDLISAAGGTQMEFTRLDFDTNGACDQAHFQTPDRAFADEELLPWIFSQVRLR